MKQRRIPQPLTLAGYGLALGAASGLCTWLILVKVAGAVPGGIHLPGVVLGIAVFVAGQIALGWPAPALARALILAFTGPLAWYLARETLQLGGSLKWVSSSLAGALGVAAGILLAWPRHAPRARVLAAMAVTGVAGGLLFAWVNQQMLRRNLQSSWLPVAAACAWHGTLIAAAALALRRPNAGSRP